MKVCGREVVTRGRFVKIASLDGEKYLILDEPNPAIEELRSSGVRADLFTFLQRLPDKSPKFEYPFEMDNLAAMPITTFDDWWNKQIRSYARNRARRAEKGVSRYAKYRLMTRLCAVFGRFTTNAPSGKARHFRTSARVWRRCGK